MSRAPVVAAVDFGKTMSTFGKQPSDDVESNQDVTPKRCYPVSRFATFAQFRGPFNARRGICTGAPTWQEDTLVSESNLNTDSRLAALTDWLSTIPVVAGLPLAPASGDASFRRYFRLRQGARSWIVMDAPPPMEDCRPFLQIAGLLRAMDLNVPEIQAADLDQGFLLMSDLGSRQYLEVLKSDTSVASRLYDDALQALITMQTEGEAVVDELPAYDRERLGNEMCLFRDWLCGRHLGIELSQQELEQWQRACNLLVDGAMCQPTVFVHRDYHSRNLMLTDENNPGILDFQDAMRGPLSYDLVSLLKDCYIRLPDEDVRRLTSTYYSRLSEPLRSRISADDFNRGFDLMGVQRHLKASGIFARLLHRDGKNGYMADVPRTLRYIVDVAPRYRELGFLHDLIADRVLPRLESPECKP